MNQGNNNNHNKNRKNNNNNNSKYAHLKHTHVPRILQNNMPAFFDVYTPESDAVYNIAAKDIIHLPNDYQEHYSKGHNQHNNHRLILCPHFHNKDLSRYHHYRHQEGEQQIDDYENTLPFCPHGDQCSNVHAHLENARVNNDIHVNFAYKNLQEVKYPRYGSNCADGASLRIAPPNQTAPVEDLPAHLCIQTNAYIGRDRITSHCAHYFYNRVCLRGSKCFFVHAVSLEPVSSSTNNKSNKNNNKSTVENNTNNTFDENKINNTYEEGCFHVDPQFRRIYGRTEPLRRQNNNNNHQTQGHHYNNSSSNKKQQLEQLQQPLQPTYGHQSFFAAAFSQNQHQQPQQQPRNIITKKTSFTDSYASSPSSHHDDFEESEETMMMIPDENLDEIACNNHHHQQQQQQQQPQHQQYHQLQSSSSSSCTPRMLCQGCRKFVHNPYSWTQTTVCLARTSPVSPSTPASH